jgi:hypothetical protein
MSCSCIPRTPARLALAMVVTISSATMGGRCRSFAQPITAESFSIEKLLAGSDLKVVDEPLNQRIDCGVRCAYLMLRLFGWNGDYEEVQRTIPLTTEGCTLADLRTSLNKFGGSLEAIKCLPENLEDLPLPAIAHMEPGGPRQHFVVVTSVGPQNVTFLEPNSASEWEWERSAFTQNSTGYYLAPVKERWSTFLLRSAFFQGGVVLILAGVARFMRHGTARVLPKHCVPLIAASLCLSGCESGSVSVAERDILLTVNQNTHRLGRVTQDSSAQHNFSFRNESSRPLQLKLGPSSCACLDVKLLPEDNALDPGEAGTLAVTLDTLHRKDGGLISASQILYVVGTREVHKFEVSAVMEGFARSSVPYVIRPNMIQSQEIPPIEFFIFTYKKDTPVEITSVRTSKTAAEWLDKTDPRASLAAESLVGMGPAVSGVHIKKDSMSISSPTIYGGEIYFRSITIPVEVSSDIQNCRGDIFVEYRIGDEAVRNSSLPFIVLASSLNESPL